MRHKVAGRTLNIDTQHRLALRRNLARSLFLHGRVVTHPVKAKAVRPFVERLITRARKAVAAKEAGQKARWLHLVRLLARDVKDRDVLKTLLAEIAPRSNRPGGYTRILHHSKRQLGDRAPLAVFELVDKPAPEPTEGEGAKKAEKGGEKKGSAAAGAQGAKKGAEAAKAAGA